MKGLGGLDRGARWLRRLLVLVVVLFAARGALVGDGTPRPGPGEYPGPTPTPGRAETPGDAGIRYVAVDRTLPAVRGRIRFPANGNEAGRTYIGTAFATSAPAVWATARHVVEGCRRAELRTGRGAIAIAGIAHDRDADLSLVFAPTGGGTAPARDEPLPLDAPGLDGFAMGYPGGTPASVHLDYLGRVAAQSHDRARGDRWAAGGLWQIRRDGLFDQPELGGISGGPLFDRAGALIGIVVGGQPRRARAISIDPVNLTALLEAVGERPARPGDRPVWRHPGIAPDNADAVRRALVGDGLLALVVCRT